MSVLAMTKATLNNPWVRFTIWIGIFCGAVVMFKASDPASRYASFMFLLIWINLICGAPLLITGYPEEND